MLLSRSLLWPAYLPIASSAEAAVGDSGLGARLRLTQLAPIEKAQFFFGGYNYCWYDDGWQGPGCTGAVTPGIRVTAGAADTVGTAGEAAMPGRARSMAPRALAPRALAPRALAQRALAPRASAPRASAGRGLAARALGGKGLAAPNIEQDFMRKASALGSKPPSSAPPSRRPVASTRAKGTMVAARSANRVTGYRDGAHIPPPLGERHQELIGVAFQTPLNSEPQGADINHKCLARPKR